jgi:hypothetical protein
MNCMGPIGISLAVIFSVLIIYFGFVFFAAYWANFFKKRILILKESLILENQLQIDNFKKLDNLCINENLNLEKLDYIELNGKIQLKDIKGMYHYIFLKMQSNLNKIKQSNLANDKTFEKIVRFFNETDLQYRFLIEYETHYLKGYNYWINLWLVRPFMLLLKFEKMDLLS